jgi:hypothetical protein
MSISQGVSVSVSHISEAASVSYMSEALSLRAQAHESGQAPCDIGGHSGVITASWLAAAAYRASVTHRGRQHIGGGRLCHRRQEAIAAGGYSGRRLQPPAPRPPSLLAQDTATHIDDKDSTYIAQLVYQLRT